jgi:hypothetical protein
MSFLSRFESIIHLDIQNGGTLAAKRILDGMNVKKRRAITHLDYGSYIEG